MHLKTERWTVMCGLAAVGVMCAVLGVAAAPPETFTATASVKSLKGSGTAPVTFTIERFVSDADRDKVLAAVKTKDHAAIKKTLQTLPDIGYIDAAQKKTPIKFAYARSTGSGRLITIVTAEPIVHLGGAAPEAKPKAGYDLALALLILDASDKGDGEITPAVKLTVNDTGGIVTEDYSGEVIRLTGITKAK